VFREEGVVSRVAIEGLSMRVQVNPKSVPEVNHGAVRWESELKRESNEVDFSEHAESLSVWLL
jgi:hypothetical protein